VAEAWLAAFELFAAAVLATWFSGGALGAPLDP